MPKATLATWIDVVGAGGRARAAEARGVFRSRPGMDRLDLQRAVFRYRVAGDGPITLVLAADPPIVIEHYDELIDELARTRAFRVVVFELPGFGFSFAGPGAEFTFVAANDLVAAFLDRLGFGPYVLAFPCVGAYGAVDIAARHPELVRGVVLIQAPSWAEEIRWKHGRDRTGLLSRPVVGQLALHALKRRRAPDWFAAAVGRRDRLAAIEATADDAFRRGARFSLASAFQRYLTDEGPTLPVLRQPALVVWGDADRSHRTTDKSSTRLYCPAADEVRFAEAGHFPELEEPARFASAVESWAVAANPR